jgi:hypothetical protein
MLKIQFIAHRKHFTYITYNIPLIFRETVRIIGDINTLSGQNGVFDFKAGGEYNYHLALEAGKCPGSTDTNAEAPSFKPNLQC